MNLLFAILSLISPPGEAPADLAPVSIHVAALAPGEAVAADRAVTATAPAAVTLYAVLEARDAAGRIWWITDAPKLELHRRKVRADRILPAAVLVPRGVVPRWTKLEAARGSYTERSTPLAWQATDWGEGWSRRADVHPTLLDDQFPEHPTGLGVMRYQVAATWGEETLASPGLDEEGRRRIAERAAKVTLLPELPRWLPQLFALVNTPYMWGNLAWHADGQYASDCADFIVAAWRRAGRRIKYTNSYGMKGHGRRTIPISDADQAGAYLDGKGRRILFGEGGVAVGDVIFWTRHVGVLLKDACTGAPGDILVECAGNGYLDADDLVVHTVWKPPTVEGIREAYGDPKAVFTARF